MKRLALYVLIIAVTVAALILLWQFRSCLLYTSPSPRD